MWRRKFNTLMEKVKNQNDELNKCKTKESFFKRDNNFGIPKFLLYTENGTILIRNDNKTKHAFINSKNIYINNMPF